MLICPSCRKRYKTGLTHCKQCGTDLLSSSTIELRNRHPESETDYALPHENSQRNSFIELAQCNLNEIDFINRLFELEGIICQIEKNDGLGYHDPPKEIDQTQNQSHLTIKVKTSDFSKAHALLSWEIAQELNGETFTTETLETETRCPSCGIELPSSIKVCSQCDISLKPANTETILPVYRCSACGIACHDTTSACHACGARLDH